MFTAFKKLCEWFATSTNDLEAWREGPVANAATNSLRMVN
jgi:hypothetical protein